MNVLRDVVRTIPISGPCVQHPKRPAAYRITIHAAASITVLMCFDCTRKTLTRWPASEAVELTRRD